MKYPSYGLNILGTGIGIAYKFAGNHKNLNVKVERWRKIKKYATRASLGKGGRKPVMSADV